MTTKKIRQIIPKRRTSTTKAGVIRSTAPGKTLPAKSGIIKSTTPGKTA